MDFHCRFVHFKAVLLTENRPFFQWSKPKQSVYKKHKILTTSYPWLDHSHIYSQGSNFTETWKGRCLGSFCCSMFWVSLHQFVQKHACLSFRYSIHCPLTPPHDVPRRLRLCGRCVVETTLLNKKKDKIKNGRQRALNVSLNGTLTFLSFISLSFFPFLHDSTLWRVPA